MPLKVLHCPTTVGGNPQGLVRAEQALGLESSSVVAVQNYFQYKADVVLAEKGRLAGELLRWYWALIKSKEFDVIHYNSGLSLLPHRLDPGSLSPYPKILKKIYNLVYARWVELLDVKLASKRGQVVCVTYQGDDIRQGRYCRDNYEISFVNEVEPGYYTDCSDRLKIEKIREFDKYADCIYALNPDLLNILPERARFLPYAHIDLKDWIPIEKPFSLPGELHVIHAPSNRAVKGTGYILDAFEKLKQEGVCFRYTLIEGLSNAEARKVYETADLLVDQLFAGYYGALSVELMALGKPVICYMRDQDMHHLPAGMRRDLPLIQATSDTIYDVLKTWLTTRAGELHARGESSRAYVERWHDPEKVAGQLKMDYEVAFSKKQKLSK